MKFLSDILAKAGLVVDGNVTLNSVANATTDTDKFLTIDSGVVKFRTGAQLLSDIGGQAALTNPVTGTGTSGQVAYFNGTNSITSNAAFAFTPTSQLLVNNSVTAASAIARGINFTPTLVAAANSDVLVGLDINPTFTNSAFTGVSNIGLRLNNTGFRLENGISGSTTFYNITTNSYAFTNRTSTTSIGSAGSAAWGLWDNTRINGFFGHGGSNVNIGVSIGGAQVGAWFATGNLFVGSSPADGGFKLDVNGTARVSGAATLSNLAGTGTRMVVADANGLLSTQAIASGSVTGTGTTNYIPKFTSSSSIGNSIIFDDGNCIGINTSSPYSASQFKLDVNGGFIVKNTSGVNAQFVMINSDPAAGGNNAFFVQTVGGSTTTTWAQIQTYYGTSIAAGALRLQPAGGQILVGTTTASAFTVDINGTLRVSGQLTLGSTITNGTFTYTLPGATGTLALTSDITTAVANLVASAPGALDTLNELAAALGNDAAFSTTVTTALGNRLRVDTASQGLTGTQQGNGRTNLGLGSLAILSSVGNANITDLAYSKLTGVPSTFAPSAHTHVWTDITDRPTNLSAFTNGPGYITSSSLSSYVPYTGATTSVDLGTNNMSAQLYRLEGTGSSGAYLAIKQYAGSLSGAPGYTSIYAVTQNSLYIRYSQTDGSQKNVELSSALLGTTTRQYLFPNASGTFALTSDIPSLSGYVQGTGTTNYLPKFTGASTIGNSIVFDDGSGIRIGTTTHALASNRRLTVVGASAIEAVATGTGGEPTIEMWQKHTAGDNVFAYFFTEASATTRGYLQYDRSGNRLNLVGSGNGLLFTGAATFSSSVTAGGTVTATSSANSGLLAATNSTTGYAYLDLINNGASGRNYQIGVGGNSTASGYANNLYFDLVGVGNVITLTSGRNVGIGTQSPIYRLEVQNSSGDSHIAAIGTAPSIQFASANSGPANWGTIGMATATNNFLIGAVAGDLAIINRGTTAGNILFGFGSTERARFTNAGQLRLNTYTSSSAWTGTAVATLGVDSSGNVITVTGGGGSSQWTTSGSDIFYSTGRVAIGTSTFASNRTLIVSRASETATGQLELRNVGGISDGFFDGIYFTQSSDGSTPLGSIRLVNKSNGYPDIAFYTRSGGLTESVKVTLLNNGNVGIGLTNPSYKLHVVGSTDIINATSTSTDARINIGHSGNGGYVGYANIGAGDASNTFYVTNGSGVIGNGITMNNAGNVGIGTTSPGQKLHVVGYTRTHGISLHDGTVAGFIGYEKQWLGSGSNDVAIASEGGNNIRFYTNGTTTVRLMLNTTGQALFNTTTNTTTGSFTNTTMGIKQLADGVTGGGLHIEQASNTNVAYFGFNGGRFIIGTSYRSTGSYQPISLETSAASRIYIETNGFVGIGTTSPQDRLDVNGSIRFRANTPNFTAVLDNAVLDFVPTSIFPTTPCIRLAAIGTASVGAEIRFLTGTSTSLSTRLTIAADGAATFTSTVNAKSASTAAALGGFSVMGSGEFMSTGSLAGYFFENRSGGTVTSSSNWYGWYATSAIVRLYNGSTDLISINGATGATTFTSSITCTSLTETSTIKVKENIVSIDSALDQVEKLQAVSYNRKGSSVKEIGLIAEAVEEVYPEFVQYDQNGEPIGLNYSRLTAVLIESVKELKNRIQQLENRN